MCASYKAALDAGHPVKIEVDQSMTLADGNYQIYPIFNYVFHLGTERGLTKIFVL